MRILVTGGAGFIGSHIADALLARGHEVAVLDDLSTGNRDNVPDGAEFVEGDIRDGKTITELFRSFRPQAINHQAAQTSVSISTKEPFRDADVNIMGTLRLLDAAVAHGLSRFVFASTGGAMYGEVPEGRRADTDWLPRPLSPYGCSKLAGESYLQAYGAEHGLPYTILRYANVYGPRQDPHGEAGVVAIFTQRLLAGQDIRVNARKDAGDEGCVRDYVYVGDVVDANRRALEGEFAEAIVNVATGTATTTMALARRISEHAGSRGRIDFGPRRAGDLEASVLQPSGALGDPESLAAGIAATVAWFRGRGGD